MFVDAVLVALLLLCIIGESMNANGIRAMVDRPLKCEVYPGKKYRNVLYHLPTNEGLMSHFNQLTLMWTYLEAMNQSRTIVEGSFEITKHYGDTRVVICDVFDLPANIKCSCNYSQEIGPHQKYCPYLYNQTASMLGTYGLNYSHITTRLIEPWEVQNTSCIAGFVGHTHLWNSTLAKFKQHQLMHPFPCKFSAKYEQLVQSIKSLPSVREYLQAKFIVVHWRRGDQLTLRCGKKHKDSSVNCGTVTELINATRSDPFIASHSELPIYVATNEDQNVTLNAIHAAGLFTSSTLIQAIKQHLGFEPSLLEMFVVELMLMCQAEYFLSFGTSSIHSFVTQYRERNQGRIVG